MSTILAMADKVKGVVGDDVDVAQPCPVKSTVEDAQPVQSAAGDAQLNGNGMSSVSPKPALPAHPPNRHRPRKTPRFSEVSFYYSAICFKIQYTLRDPFQL